MIRLVLNYLRYWILGYTEFCVKCGCSLKGPMFNGKLTGKPYWKYCPRCGLQMWSEEEDLEPFVDYESLIKCVLDEKIPKAGQPILFGFSGRNFVAFTELLNYPMSENSVQIYDDYENLMAEFCEPMRTSSIIDMFCEEYEAGRAT